MELKYRRLVNAHQRQVYSLALRALGNSAEAEDLCQDVYEKLWKNIRSVEEDCAGAWLKQVCRNACIDSLRKRRPSDEFGEQHEMQTEFSLAQVLHSSRLSRWLKSAISELKEPYRSIVICADLKEQNHKQIAQACDLNENQVKVYLHRARVKLREKLQGAEL